jgi:hypothetical protein
MAKSIVKARSSHPLFDLMEYYNQPVKLTSVLPINLHVSSAKEETMVSLLGAPRMPLTTHDQRERASAGTKALEISEVITAHVFVTGIRPAVTSLLSILPRACASEKDAGHDLASVLGTQGMLNVRLRKPTSGLPSTKISNHSWGTAVDFQMLGQDPPGNTHDTIPRFIAVLLPFFNEAGWYSGIGFHDTMHFEVADETMRKWANDGSLKA